MDLLQLKYFSEVAKREHLNQTAQEMMVTPSAISSSLARLEAELGVKLFDRVGRGIRLNEYGKVLQKYANQVFTALDSAQAELKELQQGRDLGVTVAVTNPNLWNHPLQEFSTLHPEISLSVIAFDTGYEPNYLQRLDTRMENVDFYIAALGALGDEGQKFESEILFSPQVCLAVPRVHRFAHRTEIDLAEAKDEWFINPLRDTSFRSFCDDLCQRAGFMPKSKVECDYILRPKMMINEDMVCIATTMGKRSGFYDNAVMLPIVSPRCSRPQAIHWRAHSYQSESARVFKQFMLDYCHKLD